MNYASKDEIMIAVSLHSQGCTIKRIGEIMERSKHFVSRHIKSYERFGDSYFTDYPTPLNRK